jgi:hypothetical protein
MSKFTPAAAFAIFVTVLAASRASAGPDDACSLLTLAQIKSAAGTDPVAGKPSSSNKVCTWNMASPSSNVKIITLMLQDPKMFNAGKNAPTPVTSVSGIGDDAYFMALGDMVSLFVKKGSISFKVAVYAKLPVDQKEAIEKSLATQVASQL